MPSEPKTGILETLLLLTLGRCGICNKLWTGPCYHPHPSGKRGEFITQRVKLHLGRKVVGEAQ